MTSRAVLPAILALAIAAPAAAQQRQLQTRNVVLIVSDGLRWQEIFAGADPALVAASQGVDDTVGLRRDFVRATAEDSRRELMPFLWDVVSREGVLFGNHSAGGDARVTNGLKFSYPGYNEMLSGAADPRVDRNAYGPNPNLTVFEYLNRQAEFSGKVAAYGTWEVFRDIFARARTGLWVRAGWEQPFPSPANEGQRMIDNVYRTTIRYWSDNAFDGPLHLAALDYIRTRKPRLMFVGYGETDEWAHQRRYDLYLRSAHQVDADIAELWNTMQGMSEYRGTTTFIITCDHGRGSGNDWPDHGREVADAEHIWIAIIGPDTPAGGMVTQGPVTQSQIAATIATLLGQDFRLGAPNAAPPISQAFTP